MKVIIILVIIIGTDVFCEADPGHLEEQLATALEAWRTGTDQRLPSIDPIALAPVSNVYQQFGVKISYTASEMTLGGLSQMVVLELRASNSTLKGILHISVPLITLFSGKYELKGTAYVFIPIKCKGKAEFKVHDSDIWLDAQLGLKDGRLVVTYVSVNFTVGIVEANLEGCSHIVTSMINKNGANILNQHRSDIAIMTKEWINVLLEKL